MPTRLAHIATDVVRAAQPRTVEYWCCAITQVPTIDNTPLPAAIQTDGHPSAQSGLISAYHAHTLGTHCH